jgi:hypothetical protein
MSRSFGILPGTPPAGPFSLRDRRRRQRRRSIRRDFQKLFFSLLQQTHIQECRFSEKSWRVIRYHRCMPFAGRLPRPPTGGSHKFAMSLRLMRRPGNSQPLTHPWRALPDPQAWGDLPSHLGQGSRALPDAACLSKLSARSTGAVVGEPLPRAAGVLSPGPCPQLQCRHLGDPLPGQLYRLLLIALQLALASNPVQISTRNQTGIPPAREWFNGNHQAASPDLSAGNPSLGFG